MKRNNLHLALPLLLRLLGTCSSPAGTPRIVAVGDSWAALMAHPGAGRVLQTTLMEQGYKDVEVLASDDTVAPGSRADQWAANQKGKLDHLRQALAKHRA